MKKCDRKKTLAFVLIVYLLVLFRITVFRSRSYPIDFSVNLSLFTDIVATYYENGIWMVLYLVVGNIVWFVPFGFLLPLIWKKLKSFSVIPMGLCLSLIIEVCQLVFDKGMFEIDELIIQVHLSTLTGTLPCSVPVFCLRGKL